jgi:hypothetical protein
LEPHPEGAEAAEAAEPEPVVAAGLEQPVHQLVEHLQERPPAEVLRRQAAEVVEELAAEAVVLQPRQQRRKISSAPNRICFMSPI